MPLLTFNRRREWSWEDAASAQLAAGLFLFALFFGVLGGAKTVDAILNIAPGLLGLVILGCVLTPFIGVAWLVCRRVGRDRFILGVALAYGVTLGIAGTWILAGASVQQDYLKAAGLLALGAFAFGRYGPGFRRLAAIYAIGGTVWALYFFFYRGAYERAAIGGALALVGGLLYQIMSTDLRQLGRTVAGQVVGEVRASTGQIVQTVVAFLIFAGLVALIHRDNISHPPIMTSGQAVAAYVAALFSGLVAGAGVLSTVIGLLRSLVPATRAGVDAVAEQKIHGRAGYAGRAEVDSALRDQDAGRSKPPRFKD